MVPLLPLGLRAGLSCWGGPGSGRCFLRPLGWGGSGRAGGPWGRSGVLWGCPGGSLGMPVRSLGMPRWSLDVLGGSLGMAG